MNLNDIFDFQDEMSLWIAKINQAITDLQSPSGPLRSQTLPAERSGSAGGGDKKKGFFTMKKK